MPNNKYFKGIMLDPKELVSELQKTGFSQIKDSPFSPHVRDLVLDYAFTKIRFSNENRKSLIFNGNDVYLPEEASYSGVRNLSIKFSVNLPKKTIIYRRHDSDERGLFLDIINPDIELDVIKKEIIDSNLYKELEKPLGICESDIEFHIYYTNSCLKPRSWHIDGPSYKIFTYLTDVNVEHGPYAYQLKSQRFYDREFEK